MKQVARMALVAGMLTFGANRIATASEQADRDGIVARFEKLQNLSAEFTQRTEHQDSPKMGVLEKNCSFSFLHGAARYEERFTEETVKRVEENEIPAALRYWVRTYTDEWTQDLREYPSYDKSVKPTRVTWKKSAAIASASYRHSDEDSIIDVALGLRPMHPGGPVNVPKWLMAHGREAQGNAVSSLERRSGGVG